MKLDVKFSESNQSFTPAFGEGYNSISGEDGATFYPYVSEEGIISWTNDRGLENPAPVNIRGKDGVDGKDGQDGQDGYTPVKGVDYFDGKDGSPGAAGKDGAPGKDGEPGKDGVSPTATVTQTSEGAVWSVTDKNGTTTATIKNGKDGNQGLPGQDGYTPQKGVDYFDGEQGPRGESGLPAIVSLSGATQTISLINNTDYHCADAIASLTVTGFSAGEDGRSEVWSIQFIAGDTITVALPDTVIWNYGATPVFTAGSEYTLVFTPMLSGKVLGVWNEVEA